MHFCTSASGEAAGLNRPSHLNPLDQTVQGQEVNPPAMVLADKGWARIGGDNQKVVFGVGAVGV